MTRTLQLVRAAAVALTATVLLLAPRAVVAQSQTGNLTLQVIDADGNPIPDVAVTLEGAKLQGFQLRETDQYGRVRFPFLPPGTYTAEFVAEGYVSIQAEFQVSLGATPVEKVQLTKGTIVETVTVQGSSPIDVSETATTWSFDEETIQNIQIGSGGRSYLSVLGQAAGVVGGGGNPNVRGATIGENRYLVDGVDITDPVTGTFGQNLNFDSIEAVELKTGGYQAEYGLATGGVVNVITKSGGNEFYGDVDIRYDDESFIESSNLKINGSPAFDNDASQEFKRFDVTLGGPIKKDKLWYLVSWSRIDNSRAIAGGRMTRDFEGDFALGKLTWQPNQNHRVAFQFRTDPADVTADNAGAGTALEAHEFQEQGADSYAFNYWGTFGSNWDLRVNAGYYSSELNAFPLNGVESGDPLINDWTGFLSGNYNDAQYSKRKRRQFGFSATYTTSGRRWHEIKFGAELNDNSITFYRDQPGTAEYTVREPCPENEFGLPGFDCDGDGLVDEDPPFADDDGDTLFDEDPIGDIDADGDGRTDDDPCNGIDDDGDGLIDEDGIDDDDCDGLVDEDDYDDDRDGQVDEDWGSRPWLISELKAAAPRSNDALVSSVFVQDTWHASDRVTVDYGLRIDRSRMENDQGKTIFSASKVQPRLGVAIDLLGDGRHHVSATAGRFMDPNILALATSTNLIGDVTELYLDEQAVGELFGIYDFNGNGVVDEEPVFWQSFGSSPSKVSSDIKATYRDELSFRYRHAIRDNLIFGVSYTWNQTKDIIEDTEDPNNPGSYIITNYPGLVRRWNGIELTSQYDSKRWHVNASWTVAWSKGNVEYTQSLGTDYDILPFHARNRYGYLSDDRRHRIKVQSWVDLPKQFSLHFDAFYGSGRAYNRLDTSQGIDESGNLAQLPYGVEFVAPRGAYRINSIKNLDMEIKKGFDIGKTELKLVGSIFNVFKAGRVTTRSTVDSRTVDANGDIVSAPGSTFGAVRGYQSPRSYQIGLHLKW